MRLFDKIKQRLLSLKYLVRGNSGYALLPASSTETFQKIEEAESTTSTCSDYTLSWVPTADLAQVDNYFVSASLPKMKISTELVDQNAVLRIDYGDVIIDEMPNRVAAQVRHMHPSHLDIAGAAKLCISPAESRAKQQVAERMNKKKLNSREAVHPMSVDMDKWSTTACPDR